MRTCQRNNPADPQVSEEGGGGDAPGAGAEIPLQTVVKTMVRQAVPLQPMEVHGGADIHLQPMEDPTPEQVGARRRLLPRGKPALERAPGRTCGSVERSPRSRFSGRTCDPVGDPRWSSVLLKDYIPWKGPMLEQFVKNCSPWEGPTLEKFVEDCLPWVGPHVGAGEECDESSP